MNSPGFRAHVEIFCQDLRHAAHSLLRAPIFTAAAVIAMALGTGAGTAVFSVVDRILFRSLPYPEADRLVSFGMTAPIVPQEFLLAYDYLDWRDAQTPFVSLGAWSGAGDCDLTENQPVRLRCARVDAALLPTLGIPPLLGHTITPAEDRPGAAGVAMISSAIWHGRFAGDASIVGKTMNLDGQTVTVAGVLPPEFELPALETADVLLPMALNPDEQRTRKIAILISAIGRLKPGVTAVQAKVALAPLLRKSLEFVTPAFRNEVKLRVRPLRDRQIQDARLAAWILLAAVFAVLAIACANVAHLLLARATARQREFATRAALGAGRCRLIRQALAESSLLALSGGLAGCGLAFVLLRVFVALAPGGIPRLNQAAIDPRVLLFTLAMSLLCGLVFGFAPALAGARAASLAGARTVGARHGIFRQVLIAGQIAISLILLVGAALLLRSLWGLLHQPLGMRTDGLLTAQITLGQKTHGDAARRAAFFDELESRLRHIPGVADLAVSSSLPPAGNPAGAMLYAAIDVQGRPQYTSGTGGSVVYRLVTPRYFATLGIPVLRGRDFEEADKGPDRNPIVLSDALARRMFPGEDPIGKQVKPGRVGPWRTVIGVAGNVKNNGLAQPGDPEYYEIRKRQVGRGAVVAIRTAMDPGAMARWVRAEVAALDPGLPVEIGTMQREVGKLASAPRFDAMLLGLFAGMGLLLAAVGIYGVIAFLVAQRTQEIGVRMALGATPGAIARMVLGDAARWTVAGGIAGVAGSLLAARWLESLLFHVGARDPWTLAGMLALLSAVAMAAAWVPSRRAARLDPMAALRHE